MRVVERRQELGLALEPREPLGVVRELRGRTLIATSRPSLVSRARYTSPMPPAPSGATTSYEPSELPASIPMDCEETRYSSADVTAASDFRLQTSYFKLASNF